MSVATILSFFLNRAKGPGVSTVPLAAGIAVAMCLGTLFSCGEKNRETVHDQGNSYLELPLNDRVKPEHATASFKLFDSLTVSLFASEPMVVNPTNLDIDEKGRVWICESYNYAVPKEKQKESGGRIIILEDTNHDGKADKRSVYYQGEDVNIALGIAVLGNKVYVARSPDMLIFTDQNGDDVPDKKEKLLTGMGQPGDHSVHAVVFGPDGKFYFNMGNQAGPVMDKNGKTIIDLSGNEVIQNGKDYIGGMVFRCNPDGSQMEVLAHNFRNNYEVTVDSYGNLWQSDNDDDGNRSCRINFVMEYGNYGYVDEITRQSWHAQRTNMEDEIPQRHWHQNDPGVVPNLLVTGAGSPAGIVAYEGAQLPGIFHGQILHADAGPNVVRAYLVENKSAGYTAKAVDMVRSEYDQWFRPVDVCVAPDGSVFVADWYDPGVGGGAAADSERGRIFRISGGASEYEIEALPVNTLDKAIIALKSPNQATRFLGWNMLHDAGEGAESYLLKLYASGNPLYRARALWLLGRIPGKEKHYTELALSDANPDIRIVGIRMARQTGLMFEASVNGLVNDSSPAVRREIAIGLHLSRSPASSQIWSDLAVQYDGRDRWYLEALGIGASGNWDACFEAWIEKAGNRWNDPPGRDIVWRSRSSKALPLLKELIADPATGSRERQRYFRAFDFHTSEAKQQILMSLLEGTHPDQEAITSLALHHIDPALAGHPAMLRRALESTLKKADGTQEFIDLVRRYHLIDRNKELLDMAVSHGGEDIGIDAASLLLSLDVARGTELLRARFGKSEKDAIALIRSLGPLGNRQALGFLSTVTLAKTYTIEVRKAAVSGLGKTWPGESALLECVKDPGFDDRLKPAAGNVLFNAYRVELQQEAENYLPRPKTSQGKALPTLRNLVQYTGNAANGKDVFGKYCVTCHIVNGEGSSFGPALSEIGRKLSREGLYRAIMFPSEGISYGYEGLILKLKDGTQVMGLLENETSDVVELRMMNGVKSRYNKAAIDSMTTSTQSPMPNLLSIMSEGELVDLVEYLSALK